MTLLSQLFLWPRSAAPRSGDALGSRLLRCWPLGKILGLNSREDEGGWAGRDWRGSLLPRALPHRSTPAPAVGSPPLPGAFLVMHLPLPNPALSQTLCVTLENPSLPSVPHFPLPGPGRVRGGPAGEGGRGGGSSPRVGKASEPQKYRPRWGMPRSPVRACGEIAQDPCSAKYY